MRCAAAFLRLLGVFISAAPAAASAGALAPLNEGGTDLYLDGVDNFFVAFPAFSLLSDWTIESWVEPASSVWGHPQCLLHLSTYSLENLFTLELDNDQWRLQYGAQELIRVVNDTANITNASNASVVNPNHTRRHHVAVTHRIVSSFEAELALYADGGLVASANMSQPEIMLPPLPFIVGACSVLVTDGFARTKHLTGHVDELRHWSAVRSQSDILAAMNYTGSLAQWPSQLSTAGAEAQYTFDTLSDFEVTDSSGRNAHGLRGSGGVSSELPRYERSVFDNLKMGPTFYEFRSHPNAACPSENCLNLTDLFYSTSGVSYNAFQILSAPAHASRGIYVTLPGNSTTLSNNMLVSEGVFLVHTESAVAFDSFRLQLCQGLPSEAPQLSRCFGQPIHEITFRVLESRPPTAGQSVGLQFPGRDGFLELRQHLPESATVEFWVQLLHLDGEQTLFSVSNRHTGVPMVSLGLSNGEFTFHFCSAVPPSGGVQPFTLALPDMLTTQPQHIAVSWEYLRSARGRAIFSVNVYRNCTSMTSGSVEVKDACAHFGSDDAALRFPTFGQHYTMGRAGLESAAFASAQIDDVRVWRRPLPNPQICDGQDRFLSGTENGLQAYFPITSADEKRGDSLVRNHVAGGTDADLRCTSVRLACGLQQGRGFAFRPSVFAVAPEPLLVETSAGVNSIRTLPPLEVPMPSYDLDNYVDYLDVRSYDSVQVQIRSLPDPRCGTLYLRDPPQAAVNLSLTLMPEALPLLFTPNRSFATDLDRFECLTAATYDVVDTHGLRSAFTATVNIAVKGTGPQVQAVEMIDPGVSDGQVDAGDALLVRFDRPTTAPADWQGLFEVLNGSLGSARNISGSWNSAGDVLLLELSGIPEGLQLTAGVSRLRFLGMSGTQVRTAGNSSYPCIGLSPPLRGSFGNSYCFDNSIFSKSEARCVPCGEGNYRSADGLQCLPCAPGTFLPRNSPGLCQPCPVGTYLPAGATSRAECIRAAPGYYVPREALVKQYTCPQKMLSESSGSTTCSRCPDGADCETSQHFRSLAVPRPSHFRTAAGRIQRCEIAAACRGWDFTRAENMCAEGMRGHLCQTCAVDWWRSYDQLFALCRRCGSSGVAGFILILLLATACVWLLAILSVDAALWGNMHAVIIRSVMNYFTAATVLSHLQPWELEGALGSSRSNLMTGILGVLFRFNGGIPAHWMGLQCSIGGSQWQAVKVQTWLWFVMPAILMLFLTMTGVAVFQVFVMKVKLRRSINQDVFKKDNFKRAATNSWTEFTQEPRFLGLFRKRAERCGFFDRLKLVAIDCIPMNIVAYFILLPPVLRMMVVPLACRKIGESGSEWRLLADPEVICWQGDHVGWFAFGIVGLVLWGLVLPLMMFVYIWRKQQEIAEDVHMRVSVMWLTDGYEPRYLYWEFLVHIRRVLLTLVAAWPDLSRRSELAMYQCIGIAALLFHYSFKPFDNRSGELLDRTERNGLSAFLLLVTITQFVLQADPLGTEDLLPVLVAGVILCLSLLVPCNAFSVETYVKEASLILIIVLLVLERMSESDADRKRLLAFVLLMFAAAINLVFILWIVEHIFVQLWDALSEALGRQKKPTKDTTDSFFRKPKPAWEIGLNTKNMIAVTLPDGTFLPKPDLPDPGNGFWHKVRDYIINSHSEARKGFIRFDVETNELVLGLHMQTYMSDTTLSTYTRKQLAKLGPFINDDERRFVAFAFRDAIIHIIVDCDLNVIPCTLLEFLIRITFAWCYAEKETRTVNEDKGIWQNPGTAGGVLERPTTADTDASDLSDPQVVGDLIDVTDKDFADQLFDGRIFLHGVTADDFQAKLEKITMMPKHEVIYMLENFLEARSRFSVQR